MRTILQSVAACFVLLIASTSSAETKVTFDAHAGHCLVNGKRFFPVGIWVYNLDTNVMADLHEHQFNTIVGVGMKPADLPLIEQHGMMCIPQVSDEWIKAAHKSDALLAWYLQDEPEEHGLKPEEVKRAYDALKARDVEHPIGLTHCQLAGPPKYKDACDFTMTDVYPITADRKWPINAVGMYTDGPRQVHGAGWPNFTFIQTFGGADSDGGKWAQPLPHEVRNMAMQALVHRANGILYFSYWPRAEATWASIVELNRDIHRLTPWLLADGEEVEATAGDKPIEVRAKKVGDGGWMIIAVNTSPRAVTTTISVPKLSDDAASRSSGALRVLRVLHEDRDIRPTAGQWREAFEAFESKVYLVGDEPAAP